MELPHLTLVQALRDRAARTPGRTALRQKDFGIWNPISWADYWARARAFGLGLEALGLPSGGHLAIISENRAEWVLAQLGAGAVGAVAVGVYPTSPWPEVAYVLEHSDAEIVVCEDQEQTDKVLEARAQLPRLRRIVVVDPKGMRNYRDDMIMTFAEVEKMGRARDPAAIEARVDAQSMTDVALMIYTSGSTGKPKGAMITWANMRAEAAAIVERLGEGPHSTHLSYLPLCHIAEQLFTTIGPIYAGGVVNFGESLRTVQEDLREVAPSAFLGVPRIWEKMHSAIHIKMMEAGPLRRRIYDAAIAACAPFAEKAPQTRSLRERLTFAFCYWIVFRALQNFVGLRRAEIVMTGAAPIQRGIITFFRTIGLPLVEVYGQTETTGAVTGQSVADAIPGAVGRPMAGAECRIGEFGELLVRGPMVFAGYYKAPDKTAEAIRDGWLHTGDVVERGDDGQYRIVDRLKDIMITAGGKNLSPTEIENAMKGSPFIKECIVIGERRKFVSALIQIDLETVGKWAERRRIAYTNFRSLAENPAVREMIEQEVAGANAGLAPVAQVRKFALLTKELDHDDDEVTATMKVRRSNIAAKYKDEIEQLYG